MKSVTIDYTAETIVSDYCLGKIGEHNATKIKFIPPEELSSDERVSCYRVAFSTGSRTIVSDAFTEYPFYISLFLQLTASPRLKLQITAYDANNDYIGKSELLSGFYFEKSVTGTVFQADSDNPDLTAEISANTIARHTHNNKPVLDELSEVGGSLTYKGQAIGSGSASGFYGECHSAASTNSKEVTVDEAFELKDGVTVTVLFDYAARIGDTTAPQTLNVNDTGDKPMMIFAASYQSGMLQINAKTAVTLTYNADTGYWIYGGFFTADSIRYGFVKLSDAVNSPLDESYSVAATPLAVKTVNDAITAEATTRASDVTALQGNITAETSSRQSSDNNLQAQIDTLVSKSDVVDIVGTYADLQNYDTSKLFDKDVVIVLADSTHSGTKSYYRWTVTEDVGEWEYIGTEAAYYSKSEIDTKLSEKVSTSEVKTPTSSNNKIVTQTDMKPLFGYVNHYDSSRNVTPAQVSEALNQGRKVILEYLFMDRYTLSTNIVETQLDNIIAVWAFYAAIDTETTQYDYIAASGSIDGSTWNVGTDTFQIVKQLPQKLASLNTAVNGKLNKNMGAENSGKVLTVNSSGEITAAEITDIIPDADSEVY